MNASKRHRVSCFLSFFWSRWGQRSYSPFVLGLALLASCGLFQPGAQSVLRRGCELKVVDGETGLPLPRVRITLITLYAGKDTAGNWSFVTDEAGIASITSLRIGPDEERKAGRRSGRYDYVALFEKEGYIFYSQRITAPEHRVALSHEFLIAAQTPDPKPGIGVHDLLRGA